MKRLLPLLPTLVVALLVTASAGADTRTVQVTQSGFTPAATTVTVGDTVTWHNADSADHQVVANDGSFAWPVLKPGDTYSFTFRKAGTYGYHDVYAKTHRGSVTVNPPPTGVSLSAGRATLTYGGGTVLSGTVTNQLADEPVTLTSQPYDKGIQSVAATTTSSSGTFSFDVAPSIQTTYRATWRTSTSAPVTVNVAPRIGFGRSGRRYIAKVTSDISYGGHFLWLQRRTAPGGWHSLKRVYLAASSRAVFAVRLPRGRSVLRLYLPSGQAGAGYVSSLSRLLTVRR